tara:strand:+ start:4121 stop:4348 length:228 start_codon:yes stop_codon:yes gene_type:complete
LLALACQNNAVTIPKRGLIIAQIGQGPRHLPNLPARKTQHHDRHRQTRDDVNSYPAFCAKTGLQRVLRGGRSASG